MTSLEPRAIATQGIGLEPRLVALQGLWPMRKDDEIVYPGRIGRKQEPIDSDDDVLIFIL